jgi:cyclomaltodextrinase
MTYITKQDNFYHIYPLGALGAPQENDYQSPPQSRLLGLIPHLDHAASLGTTAIYLGPVFESSTHGYDTADFFRVDRRLGTNADLTAFAQAAQDRGLKFVLDAVFNHVGREFWAFRDLLANGAASPYRDWFSGVNFQYTSPYNDPFSYDCWQGHAALVKLNLANPAVRQHLFDAIRFWRQHFGISGLRLDAADSLSFEFMQAMRSFIEAEDPQLWLMGEVIHGDYRRWANPAMLHSTTNYELYKSTWSAINDANFFELAYSLNRQFGEGGIYRDLDLYSFLDNHDVSRIASQLKNPANLWLAYTLLYTMPGIPALYYGSEFGLEGRKTDNDWNLRPAFDPGHSSAQAPYPQRASLIEHIRSLIRLRRQLPALTQGSYRQLSVSAQQFAFLRWQDQQRVIVAANSSSEELTLKIQLPAQFKAVYKNVLNGDSITQMLSDGSMELHLYPHYAAVLAGT